MARRNIMNLDNLNNFTIPKEQKRQHKIPVATIEKKIEVKKIIKQRSCYFERNARVVRESHTTYNPPTRYVSKTGQASQVHTRRSTSIHLRKNELNDKTNLISVLSRNLSLLQRERNSPHQNLLKQQQTPEKTRCSSQT